MKHTIVVRELEEAGYPVKARHFPAVFSQAETMEQALFNANHSTNIKEAIEPYIEGLMEKDKRFQKIQVLYWAG